VGRNYKRVLLAVLGRGHGVAGHITEVPKRCRARDCEHYKRDDQHHEIVERASTATDSLGVGDGRSAKASPHGALRRRFEIARGIKEGNAVTLYGALPLRHETGLRGNSRGRA